MARAAAIGVVLLLLAQNLAADQWPGPRVMTVFSEDGGRFVRVTPGESLGDSVGFAGAKHGAYARALFYERQTDRSYRLTAEIALLNPIAPVCKFTYYKGTAECQSPARSFSIKSPRTTPR